MATPVQKLAAALAAHQMPNKPTFNHEGPDLYAAAMAQNGQYAKPAPTSAPGYNTRLDPKTEGVFRAWLQHYNVPFDPNAKQSDYDMRAYFQATNGAPHTAGQHFPDTYKTPMDTTFSNESKYAKKNTPFKWVGNTLVNVNTGQSVFE